MKKNAKSKKDVTLTAKTATRLFETLNAHYSECDADPSLCEWCLLCEKRGGPLDELSRAIDGAAS